MVCLMSDWFCVFNFSTRHLFLVLGVRAQPLWGLPQGVAVGVICPQLIFPELK